MSRLSACGLLLTGILLPAGPASATEAQGSNLILGPTTFETPVFPNAGVYYSKYFNYYSSSRVNDANGNKLFPGFRVNVAVDYNQVFYAAPFEYAGFKFGVGLVLPFAFVGERVPGADKYSNGFGDILLQPLIIGWQHGNIHAALVQGIYAPTGQYKPSDLFTLSRNTWEYQPQFSIGYINPKGFEITTTLTYVISDVNKKPMSNFMNPTNGHYRSGQEFGADFAIGYNFTPKFEAGLSGYAYAQTTSDRLSGPANAAFQAAFNGNKGQTVALGPAVRLLTPYGEFFLHFQHELYAVNRTQGNSFWARVNLAF